jgi:hypothetical protein
MKLNEMTGKEKSGKCPMSRIDSISDTILDYIRKRLKKKYGKDRPLRAVHAKSIGLVKAVVEIEKLEEQFSVGLFNTPGKYEAWIRFTNGSPEIGPDNLIGTKGMAIKISQTENQDLSPNDPGVKEQDIILLSSRTFYPAACDLQLSGIITAIGNKIQSRANGIILAAISLCRALAFLKSRLITPNVLEETYYSCTPYAFGAKAAIKWAARPLKRIASVMPDKPGYNFLREKLIEDLSFKSRHAVAFELLVQFEDSTLKDPIENTAVIWNTPFHRVATIIIPQQYLDTIERGQLDQRMYFCPSHTIKDHEPLGSVNMIRSRIYETLARERLGSDSGQSIGNRELLEEERI